MALFKKKVFLEIRKYWLKGGKRENFLGPIFKSEKRGPALISRIFNNESNIFPYLNLTTVSLTSLRSTYSTLSSSNSLESYLAIC